MSRRPLTHFEKTIIEQLLTESFPGRNEIKNQIEGCLTQKTDDNDNYGSIYLFPVNKTAIDIRTRVPVEGLINDTDGTPINVLLHVDKGLISELEIVKLDGTPIKKRFNPEKIRVVVN